MTKIVILLICMCFIPMGYAGYCSVTLFLGRHEQISMHPRPGTTNRSKCWYYQFQLGLPTDVRITQKHACFSMLDNWGASCTGIDWVVCDCFLQKNLLFNFDPYAQRCRSNHWTPLKSINSLIPITHMQYHILLQP